MKTKSRAVRRADGEPILEDGWSVSTMYHPKHKRSYSLVLRFPDIKPSHIGKAIHVKVYRKWTIAPVIGAKHSTLCLILLDQKGRAIQANAENPNRIRFDNILHINGTYTITGFELMETKTWMQTLPNRLTLILGNLTDAQPFSGTSFPAHHFNFAAYNELATRADNDDVILTDYIGCVVDVGDLRDVGNANQEKIAWRDIVLRDLEGNTVTFTLWNEKARDFNTDAYENAAKPTIMAVSSCWVKTYGGLQLSSSPATYYYFNPNIPETDYILCMQVVT